MTKEIEYEVSSGNIFADLDVDNPDEMLAKAKLAMVILKVIEDRGLTQQQAAELLETERSYISKLKTGRGLRKFSFDRLLSWLNKLDRDITLTVTHKPRKRKPATIHVTI